MALGVPILKHFRLLHRGMLCFIFAGLIRLASPDILTNTYMHAVLASVIGRYFSGRYLHFCFRSEPYY